LENPTKTPAKTNRFQGSTPKAAAALSEVFDFFEKKKESVH
jgi:hypothetical protein